jgi:hypothetical protein
VFLRFDVVEFPQLSTSSPSLRFRLRSFSPSNSSVACTRLRCLWPSWSTCVFDFNPWTAVYTLHIPLLQSRFVAHRCDSTLSAFLPVRLCRIYLILFSTFSPSLRLRLDFDFTIDCFGCVHSPSMSLALFPSLRSCGLQVPRHSFLPRCFVSLRPRLLCFPGFVSLRVVAFRRH